MHGQLTDEETAVLRQMAERHSTAFLLAYERGSNWWATRSHSNWTAVTCGGAGLLALTMWEELERAEEILDRVEAGSGLVLGFVAGAPDGRVGCSDSC